MPAHAQVSDIIEEDHARRASGIDWFTEQSADHYIRSAGLGYNGGAEAIVLAAKSFETISQRPSPEIWSAVDHESCRLTACVRVDDPNPSVCNCHSDSPDLIKIYAATGFALR